MKIHHQQKNIRIKNFNLPYHEYEEFGIQGVGKFHIPIINMDQYIDHSMDDELHIECCKGLSLTNNYESGRCNGALPPEVKKHLSDKDCLAITLSHLDKIDPTGIHRKTLEEIINTVDKEQLYQSVYKYCYYALGSNIPWFFVLYLKRTSFSNKHLPNDTFTEDSKLFPKLLKYIDTLPFKHIGRVKIFATYPNAGVVTHRDNNVCEHKDHSINLFFGAGGRPVFIWDEKRKTKVYLENNARSYFFNNRDYHGVDPEPIFRYTVRVDGTFTDKMCEKLGLVDGYTWHQNYSIT